MKRFLFHVVVFRKYDQMNNFDEGTEVRVVGTDRKEAEEEALKIVNDPNRKMVHTTLAIELKED